MSFKVAAEDIRVCRRMGKLPGDGTVDLRPIIVRFINRQSAAKLYKEDFRHIQCYGSRTRNLFPVLRNPSVFKGLIDVLVEDIKSKYPAVEVIVGLDSRGFLFGPLIAQRLNIAFVPVRKKGKLPGEKHYVEYTLEYGKDACEIQKNSIQPGQKVVIVDDLIATGGTMKAACDLLETAKAEVLACIVIVELKYLQGRDRLKYPLMSYIS